MKEVGKDAGLAVKKATQTLKGHPNSHTIVLPPTTYAPSSWFNRCMSKVQPWGNQTNDNTRLTRLAVLTTSELLRLWTIISAIHWRSRRTIPHLSACRPLTAAVGEAGKDDLVFLFVMNGFERGGGVGRLSRWFTADFTFDVVHRASLHFKPYR